MSGTQFFFDHVPKTAGTAFRRLLEQQFETEEICPALIPDDLAALPPDAFRRYRLFRGHLSLGFRNLLPSPPVVLTLVRDPAQHTISHYRHIRRSPGHPHHEDARRQSLAEFLKDDRHRDLMANFQAGAVLVEVDPRLSCSGQGGVTGPDWWIARRTELWREVTTDQALALLQERLDTIAFVGVVERMVDSLAVLAAAFSWDLPRAMAVENPAPGPPFAGLDAETSDLIRERTVLDDHLYRLASARLDAALHRLLPTPAGSSEPA